MHSLLVSISQVESELRVRVNIVEFIRKLERISSSGDEFVLSFTQDGEIDVRVEVIVQLSNVSSEDVHLIDDD